MGNAQFIFEGSLLFEDLPGSLPYWFVHCCWVSAETHHLIKGKEPCIAIFAGYLLLVLRLNAHNKH